MRRSFLLGRLALPSIGVGWWLSIALATTAQAAVYTNGCSAPTSCTFQELLGGGEIVAGGQRFAAFAVEDDPGVIDWNDVIVVGIDDAGLSPGPGLRFEHNGEARTQGTDCLDLQFSYQVKPVIPSWQPSANDLEILAQSTLGGGRIEVDEALFDATLAAVGDKTVRSDPAFDRVRSIDAIQFAPRTGLIVSNTITMEGDAPGDQAELDAWRQRFALTPVPEPAVGPLLAAGGGLLAWLGASRPRTKRVPVELRRGARPLPVSQKGFE